MLLPLFTSDALHTLKEPGTFLLWQRSVGRVTESFHQRESPCKQPGDFIWEPVNTADRGPYLGNLIPLFVSSSVYLLLPCPSHLWDVYLACAASPRAEQTEPPLTGRQPDFQSRAMSHFSVMCSYQYIP